MRLAVDCDDYHRLYPQYMAFPMPREVSASPAYSAWQEHGLDCAACTAWDLTQRVKKAGYQVEDFPCLHMAYRLAETCDQHDDAWECPDLLIVYWPNTGEYWLPIRDGGHSGVVIRHCP